MTTNTRLLPVTCAWLQRKNWSNTELLPAGVDLAIASATQKHAPPIHTSWTWGLPLTEARKLACNANPRNRTVGRSSRDKEALLSASHPSHDIILWSRKSIASCFPPLHIVHSTVEVRSCSMHHKQWRPPPEKNNVQFGIVGWTRDATSEEGLKTGHCYENWQTT